MALMRTIRLAFDKCLGSRRPPSTVFDRPPSTRPEAGSVDGGIRRLRSRFAAALAGALFSAPAIAQDEPLETPAPERGPSGVYRGVYVCNQGLTGATLRFCEEEGRLEVGFRFYAVDENPELPTGLCYLAGDYDPVARYISAEGAGWGSRPGENWIIAPFRGVFDESFQSFSGMVTSPGCSFISLQRIADDDPRAPECGPVIG